MTYKIATSLWTNGVDGVPYLWTSRQTALDALGTLQVNGIEAKIEKVERWAYCIVNLKDETLMVAQEAVESGAVSFPEGLIADALSEQNEASTDKLGRVTRKFLDYTIIDCKNSDGIVLMKENVATWECHLGNYNSVDSAKRAAVLYFMIARPQTFATGIFMRTFDGNGTSHEWFKFQEVCERENVAIPKELSMSSQSTILFNGDRLHFLPKSERERRSN